MTDEDTRTNTEIKKVSLVLPDAIDCTRMFMGCSNLVDVDLELPNATKCRAMFYHCPKITNVQLIAPKATYYLAI